MRIGRFSIPNNVIMAPMAGVTDDPFRKLCIKLGAGLAISEMVTSNPRLWATDKTRRRMRFSSHSGVRVVQLVGTEPRVLAEAARFNVGHGAEIVDINMGCPAKKVCNVAAGSALLGNEPLVARIIESVVAAVDVPVTVKIRTGPNPAERNATRIARIAEQAGVAALTVHGRTRACAFRGAAEYDTIRDVKRGVSVPVVANGDINTPEKARYVLDYTGADAIMVGRAAQGNPWIFREISHYLSTGRRPPSPAAGEVASVLAHHLEGLYHFYGTETGVRVARKHLAWYCRGRAGAQEFWRRVREVGCATQQKQMTQHYFGSLDSLALAA